MATQTKSTNGRKTKKAETEAEETEEVVDGTAAALAKLTAEIETLSSQLGKERAALPVDSYAEAAPHLRRPFTPQAVRHKVQATWPRESPTNALIVTYIDARLVIDRLNLVCPAIWSPEYEEAPSGLMWCHLTIGGITRPDVGDGYAGKGLVSDSLKRAGVQFGIGVSVYATPKIFLNGNKFLQADRNSQGRATLKLTTAGEVECRNRYAKWLESDGVRAFGQPLDHGDSDDSSGDYEADRISVPDAAQEEPDAPPGEAPKPAQEKSPEDLMAEFLAQDGPLKEKRAEADKGMKLLGAGPAQRLRELRSCAKESDLDALITRIGNAADES